MSGGHFDYKQFELSDLGEQIEKFIYERDHGYSTKYSRETINEFRRAVHFLEKAQIYVQRIDWLVSCDDSEETFHKRLMEDLQKL